MEHAQCTHGGQGTEFSFLSCLRFVNESNVKSSNKTCGSQGPNPGHHAWQQVPLSTVIPGVPLCFHIIS